MSRQRDRASERRSNQAFGWVFAGVFVILGLWPLFDQTGPRWWALAVGGLFLGIARVAPNRLRVLNRIWLRFGDLLHGLMTPLLMTLLYLLFFLPLGVVMAVVGNLRRSMPAGFDRAAATYWIDREEPCPEPERMKDQF